MNTSRTFRQLPPGRLTTFAAARGLIAAQNLVAVLVAPVGVRLNHPDVPVVAKL